MKRIRNVETVVSAVHSFSK